MIHDIDAWAALVRRWTPLPPPPPEAAVTPGPATSVLLTTTYAETGEEVAAEEQAISDRLADLAALGMSPLEAARELFVPVDERA